MNLLEVKYDEDGTKRFFRDGEEISEDVWLQSHPHMRKGKTSGRDRSSDSRRVRSGESAVAATETAGEERKAGGSAEVERPGVQRARRPDNSVG